MRRPSPPVATDESSTSGGSEPGPSALTALDPAYRAAIERVERRPENATGADKSWVSRMDAAFRRHYEQARRG